MKKLKRADAERLVEEVAALRVWQHDPYDYGACAESVRAKLDIARDDVVTLLCERLGLEFGTKR